MASILFIEDHPELIDEVAEVLLLLHPEWNLETVADIPEACQRLNHHEFDVVVIDAMLPEVAPSVPSDEAGIFLAAWITGRLKPPPELKPLRLKSQPAIVILTSRSSQVVVSELAEFGVSARVIARLSGDAYEQANVIANEAMRTATD